MCAWPTAREGVRAGVRGPGQRLGELGRGRRRGGAGDVGDVERVQRPFQGAQHLVAARVGARPAPASARRHLDVQARGARRSRRARRGRRGPSCRAGRRGAVSLSPSGVGRKPVGQDVGVGGGLQRAARPVRRRRRVRDRDVLVARLDALDRPARRRRGPGPRPGCPASRRRSRGRRPPRPGGRPTRRAPCRWRGSSWSTTGRPHALARPRTARSRRPGPRPPAPARPGTCQTVSCSGTVAAYTAGRIRCPSTRSRRSSTSRRSSCIVLVLSAVAGGRRAREVLAGNASSSRRATATESTRGWMARARSAAAARRRWSRLGSPRVPRP